MNYSHLYSKLVWNKLYTTIRKSCKVKVGDIEKETYNWDFLYSAKVLLINRVKLTQLPLSVLIMDCYYKGCNIQTRADCYALFQSFYEAPLNFSKQLFHLILLKKTV